MWSIAIYRGDSPFHLEPVPEAPRLSACDITDVPAEFVADPFMIRSGGAWHLFFEVLNAQRGAGEIGLATSPDALRWTYRGIVLRESFHLSYPHVFAWRGTFFMVPETLDPGEIRLYRADHFPLRWRFVKPLLPMRGADPSLFRFGGLWWMFVCPTPERHDALELFFADELAGPWRRHARSPIVSDDARTARPAGRVLVRGGAVTRFAQDCVPHYGTQVRAFAISRLTRTAYAEAEHAASPILRPTGSGAFASGMHHVDAHRLRDGSWIACVDGCRRA